MVPFTYVNIKYVERFLWWGQILICFLEDDKFIESANRTQKRNRWLLREQFFGGGGGVPPNIGKIPIFPPQYYV